jgi:hypothetical protein
MAITIDGADNKLEIGANATGPSSLRLYEDTDNGTNYVSIIAPSAVTSNRTLTLPDATGTVLTSTSDINTQVASSLNATGSAPLYACRAWVNFDGTSTVAIRASGNVSSITDNGTGDYTINFTNAMVDASYSVSGSMSWSSATWGNLFGLNATTISTTQVRVMSTDKGSAGYGLIDAFVACVAIFR